MTKKTPPPPANSLRKQVESIKRQKIVNKKVVSLAEFRELSEAVGRHRDAVEAVAEAGVHLALAGHFHRTYAEAALKMVETAGSVLVMQAGTATSTRLRNKELQSFNWIHARRFDEVELQVIAWDGVRFKRGSHERFTHDGHIWAAQTVTEQSEFQK